MTNSIRLTRATRWMMMMRGALPALAAIVFAAGALAAPQQVKLATLAPKGTSFHLILQEMGQKWKQAPDGGVSLTIFTDGTMGSEQDMVKRMRTGQIHGGLLTTGGLVELEPAISGLQNIPLAFQTLDEAEFVRNRLAPGYAKNAEERGFVILGWCDMGWVHVFSKKPFRTPEDLKGEKVFVPIGSSDAANIVRSVGMQPVELNPPEILVSLSTNLITVVPAPPFYALAGQFSQPAPYMLQLNWSPLVGGIVVSKRAWDRMTPGQQEVLRKSSAEAAAKIQQRGRQEADEAIAAMQKRGLEVQKIDAGLQQTWMDFAQSIYPQVRGRVVPEAAFDEIMALIKEYRAGARTP